MFSPTRPTKPTHVFDRSVEWDALAAFVSRPLPHAMLGIVSGRRRMGKTYLLRALVEQQGASISEQRRRRRRNPCASLLRLLPIMWGRRFPSPLPPGTTRSPTCSGWPRREVLRRHYLWSLMNFRTWRRPLRSCRR